MVKKNLMLGAAFAALSLIPVTSTQALAEEADVDIFAEWDNELDVELEWNVDVDKYLDIRGDIFIDGNVRADALSHATLDDKQILDQNEVQFEDYQNANLDDGIFAEPGVGTTSTSDTFEEEGAPAGPAVYSNSVSIGDGTLSDASGNIGLNIAAGDYNLQENAAVLSSAEGLIPARTISNTFASAFGNANSNFSTTTFSTAVSGNIGTATFSANVSSTLSFVSGNSATGTETATSTESNSAYTAGAAEAGSFSLQNLYDNGFNDDPESYEDENTLVTNTVSVGTGTLDGATGNIGVNAAAGAFNIQKNALVIASITGGNLAEAAAGTMQDSEFNDSVHENVTNDVAIGGSLVGATGNIGVNLAAGVGNLQLNSLTIASALLGTPTPAPTTPGGGGGTTE